ncbi:hydroxylamine oxidation protein HaoB [Methylocystis sp. Sn-Cys]|uniref:hydroxylamine oxidation protein HaoB n=1 Tax=Methylocystis sp. Sn-Cys TaxID=1701263 RepID=UPI0019239C10|nr:hydroxylamine oxidation protein HaoB [Methylocystis sp. Sn-Cys]MBL1258059.1 hydroxylamine oxidation protein HaoB [Methylocystis sp. Sn-Cys]
MKNIIGAGLIAIGIALLGWAGYSSLRPPSHYSLTIAAAPDDAAKEVASLGLAPDALQRVEISIPQERRPIAAGLVAREGGRLSPLVWRNEVTEPILFADVSAADITKVLTAIRDHVGEDAVVLAWWDLSRAIRLAAKRNAPLDDARASGLLIPAAWPDAQGAEQARLGAGAAPKSSETFDRFIDALLSDEKRGSETLSEIAAGKPAYVAVHISDVWKVAAARPERLSIAYKDFPSSGVSHGVIKSATQWMREQKIDGGFAVEPIGGATRLHYFARKGDSDALIAKLLPFSTSNPAQLERLELVYQHKGWWIYRLK